MNLNLLGTNFLMAATAAATIAIIFLIYRAYRSVPGSQKLSHKKLFVGVVLGLAAGLLLQLLINLKFPGQKLPLFFVIFWPAFIGLALFIEQRLWRARFRLKLLDVAAVGVCLLFSLAVLNAYYQYYPTLYSALGINNYKHISTSSQNSVVVRFQPLSHEALDNQSLERNLTNPQDLPTAGRVYNIAIPGTHSRFQARNANIYVPPVTFGPLRASLPVIILLAGSPGQPDDWLNGGQVKQTMDFFASRHHGITPLVVMVDHLGSTFADPECVDSQRGNVETYLTDDVPNFIKSKFDVALSSNHWAIGGLSDGGMCSVMLTLRHPDVFHYFLDFGGELGPSVGSTNKTVSELFNGSITDWQGHQPAYLFDTRSYKDMGGFFAAAKSDSYTVRSATKQLYQQALRGGFDAIYESVNGEHTFGVWEQNFKDAMPWLSNRLGATVCSTNCY